MDIIRNCYTVDVRFFADDPARVTRVQWYYTHDTTGLPFPTAFYRRQWEHDLNQEPIGEIYKTERWHGTQPPFTIGYGGYCGTAEQWALGASTSDPIPSKWPNTEIPVCCPKPPPSPVGGVGLAGVIEPCCLAENVPPLTLFWGCASNPGCCPDMDGNTPLIPFSGRCEFALANVNTCVYTTAPINIMGFYTQLLVCCDGTAGPGTTLIFFGLPGQPCKPAVGWQEGALVYCLDVSCNPFLCVALTAVALGPCTACTCGFAISS